MPLYEYTCGACKTTFEQLARAADRDAGVTCPECGSAKAKRALSLISVGADQKGAGSGDTPACGRCGEMRGSCSM